VDSCEPSSGICLHSYIPGCGLDPEDVAEDTQPGPDTVSPQDTDQPGPDTLADTQADTLSPDSSDPAADAAPDAGADLNLQKDFGGGMQDQANVQQDPGLELVWTRPDEGNNEPSFKSAGGCSTGAAGTGTGAGMVTLWLLGLGLGIRARRRWQRQG
jgi:MYXO-CTERM domain-containing protein